jgi:hypothetical protein
MSAAPHDTDPIAFATRLRATGLGSEGSRAIDDLLALVERERAFEEAYPKGCHVFPGADEHIERIRGTFYTDKLAMIFELGARLKTEHGARLRDMAGTVKDRGP